MPPVKVRVMSPAVATTPTFSTAPSSKVLNEPDLGVTLSDTLMARASDDDDDVLALTVMTLPASTLGMTIVTEEFTQRRLFFGSMRKLPLAPVAAGEVTSSPLVTSSTLPLAVSSAFCHAVCRW